jgi:hypothetical protein
MFFGSATLGAVVDDVATTAGLTRAILAIMIFVLLKMLIFLFVFILLGVLGVFFLVYLSFARCCAKRSGLA